MDLITICKQSKHQSECKNTTSTKKLKLIPTTMASNPNQHNGEEDFGALIYRESQLRKAEAAAAADAAKTKKKNEVKLSASARQTSTRKRSTAAATVMDSRQRIIQRVRECGHQGSVRCYHQMMEKRRMGNLQRKWKRRSTDMNALLMDAQIKSSEEEYAGGMGQRSNYAAVKDAQIKSSKEECAKSMGQRRNNAPVMDARTKSNVEEYAGGMGQRTNYAAVKDAQIESSKEECAGVMGQRRNTNYAASKDVQTNL